MSQNWVKRQRRTNRLLRLIGAHLLNSDQITASNLYGLCQLTWITKSSDEQNEAYIKSTKIPALGNALSKDYEGWSLEEVAADVEVQLQSREARDLILSHTGFTNFYKSYRNSCLPWIEENKVQIESISRRILKAEFDEERIQISREIMGLPEIPKANTIGSLMKPSNLITPLLFSLDPDMRFPLINGSKAVQALLAELNAAKLPLDKQFEQMIGLIGKATIQDAADLDQFGEQLLSEIKGGSVDTKTKPLSKKPTEGKPLPIKDETDIEYLRKSESVFHRKQHNVMTNTLRKLLSPLALEEGCNQKAQFDVLVKNYNSNGDDLLIEAKSSTDQAYIRMAVGQLYDYWFALRGEDDPHLAILTPEKPDIKTIQMLDWLKIGVLWIPDEKLYTCTKRLESLCSNNQ